MTPMPLELFVKKLQPKVGLGGYDIPRDILFAYFVVEAKSKTEISIYHHVFISQNLSFEFEFNILHIKA